MSIIHSSNSKHQIYYENLSSSYTEALINSILKLLPNCGATIIKTSTGNYIDFFANSVTRLFELSRGHKLKYNEVIDMMHGLNKQQTFLVKNYNCGFFYFDLKDVIVVDSTLFICINPNLMRNINSYQDFVFLSPFSRSSNSAFFSPEVILMDKIPTTITYKCFYFSLGSLAIYCLFDKNINGNSEREIIQILAPIYQTKLYWTLLKSAEIDYEKRSLLFI